MFTLKVLEQLNQNRQPILLYVDDISYGCRVGTASLTLCGEGDKSMSVLGVLRFVLGVLPSFYGMLDIYSKLK